MVSQFSSSLDTGSLGCCLEDLHIPERNLKSRNHFWELLAYTDADFALNIDDMRSTTGVVLLLNGGPVSWKSQRQKGVSLSTTESEYVAAATAAKEVVWMRLLWMSLLQDLRLRLRLRQLSYSATINLQKNL